MKLSEVLARPIKLKGGGFIYLEGLAKQIIDKELNMTASEILDVLTVKSSKTSFSAASNVTKSAAATALGITEDELDGLFAGNVTRLSYNNGAEFLGVNYASANKVTLGGLLQGNFDVQNDPSVPNGSMYFQNSKIFVNSSIPLTQSINFSNNNGAKLLIITKSTNTYTIKVV